MSVCVCVRCVCVRCVCVIHDWGSALGFHWYNMHRDRVKVRVRVCVRCVCARCV